MPPSTFKKPVVQDNSAHQSKQESVLKCEDISLVLSDKKEQPSASKVVEEMNKSEPVTAKLKESSSTYKITREQHELILKFVEEKKDVIESDISRLYTHLLINHKEAEELPMLIETLKNNNRDVENCVDDLKMYPIVNDRAFYRTIERHDGLVKNVLTEYKALAGRKLKDYKNFRDAALDHIRQYNSSQQDTGVSENTSEPHTNEENGGSQADVYNRLVEDLNKVKGLRRNGGIDREVLKGKYNDLGERVADFQKKLHQQSGLSISEKIDYNTKLRMLNEQIQQGKQEVEELDGAQTQPQYMGLSDIMSGTTSLFQSATMQQSKPVGRGSLTGPKKYDNPNLFMERKLSVNSRPEIKQGDNADNDLDMIEIEFK